MICVGAERRTFAVPRGSAAIRRLTFPEEYGLVLNLGDLAQRDEPLRIGVHFNHVGAMTTSAWLGEVIAGRDF